MKYELIIMGVVAFLISIGLNKLHDWIGVRRNIDGSYDRRYAKGSRFARLIKYLSLLIIILGILETS